MLFAYPDGIDAHDLSEDRRALPEVAGKNSAKNIFLSAVIFYQNLLRLPAKDAIVVQTSCHDRAKRAAAQSLYGCTRRRGARKYERNLFMSEIKVVPYIPDEDYDNPAMVVDFYEFTMANCLFLNGFKNTTLVFDMFFRKNPDNQGYSISAGQRKLTRFLLNYHFNEQDVHWLRTKGMSEEFCEYLRTYRWKGDMYALPEGTVCYPHVQMVRIECDLVGAILIETYLLQTMNFHSLIATKATRITGLNTHTPRSVMEFGTRRAQGESAGNDGAYAAVLGGCIGTANCLAEMKYGAEVKAVGTVAHSFIEFFPTEFDAFKAFADTYPDSVSLLLDTYNIMESGLPNLIKLDDYLIEKYPDDPNRRVKSARIDSGDLARGSKRLRKALDAAGKSYIKLVASNGLDEKKIANMELYEHAHFDSYGVGENLITSASDPVFGGVYKLVAVKQPDGSYHYTYRVYDIYEGFVTHVVVLVEEAGRQRAVVLHYAVIDRSSGDCLAEGMEIWPVWQGNAESWSPGGWNSGRLLCEKDGQSYTADFYSVKSGSYETTNIFGTTQNTGIIAEWSRMDHSGNVRAYLLYDAEMLTPEMPSTTQSTLRVRVMAATSRTGWSTPVEVSDIWISTPRMSGSASRAAATSSALTACPQGADSTVHSRPRERAISTQRSPNLPASATSTFSPGANRL